MAKLAYLFYESNKDYILKVDAKGNFNFHGNQYFKSKNCLMPNGNSDSNKKCVNTVSGDKKPEWVAQKSEKPVVTEIRCFHCKMLNHPRSECPKLQSRSTTVRELN